MSKTLLLKRIKKLSPRLIGKTFYYYPTIPNDIVKVGSRVVITEIVTKLAVQVKVEGSNDNQHLVFVSDLTFNRFGDL